MRNLVYIILPLGMISMLAGIYSGFVRIGWALPVSANLPVAHHGVLMTGSFLGTLISLERVAVLKKRWVWIIPGSMALSMLCLVFRQIQPALLLLLGGSIGYLIVSVTNYRTYKLRGDALMAAGSVFQVVALVIFYLTNSYPKAFAGWMLFLVFTITGERLNLTRFLPVTKRAVTELYCWMGLLILSSFLFHFGFAAVVGISLWGIAQWLLRNDIALINLKKDGHFRFMGLSLVCAYSWLLITGGLSMIKPGNPYLYDAVLHAFFVGFVLTMILAHAPVIFPGLLQIRQTPFHPVMYLWLATLHASLLIRIYGDLTQNYELRKSGGLINGLSFLVYLLTIVFLIIQKKIQRKV